MSRTILLLAVAATLGVTATGLAVYAAKHLSSAVPLPAALHATVTTDACSNNPGPTITVEGELLVSELNAQLIFRNNRKGTHERTEEVMVDVNLLPEQRIEFAKQPPLGGVGGNPWIYIQLFNGSGDSITDRTLLGRCVQGVMPLDLAFANLADVDVSLAGDCSNNPGPWITLTGELTLEGITAVLTFQNSRHNPPHVREETLELELVILPEGDAIRFAKQPPLGGVGGNPWIFLQFVDGEGDPVGDEILIGRCVQLSK